MRLNAKDLAHLTLVPRPTVDGLAPGPAGLFLWATDDRALPSRLKAAFARGHWLTGVKLLFPDPNGIPRVASRDGWWLDAATAATELATVPLSHLPRLSPSVGVWALASKWAIELVQRQQVVPTLIGGDQSCRAQWRVAPVRHDDRARLQALAAALPGVARCWPVPHTASGAQDASKGAAGVGYGVRAALPAVQEFADAAADGLMRAPTHEANPFAQRSAKTTAPWHQRLAIALAGPQPGFELKGVAESHLPPVLAQWAAPAVEGGTSGRPVIGYRIIEPKNPRGVWLLSYDLHPDGGEERIPVSELGSPTSGLTEVIAKMVEPEETLLDALGRCAKVFTPIARSLQQKLPASVQVSAAEAWDFITSKGIRLERAGYVVEVPAALSKVGHRRVRGRMRIGVEDEAAGPSRVGLLAGVVNYRWEACLGEDTLTEAEFQELVKSKAPLVHHRGQWVAVDPEDIARLKNLLGKGKGQLDPSEALRLALTGDVELPDDPEHRVEVICEGSVQNALALLKTGLDDGPRDIEPPSTIRAELRAYQRRGFAWMKSVTELGFGACLADDMGLGKTLQLLTLFARISSESAERGEGARLLVVCPTSVLGNWRREIRRFFPELHVVIHHGASRAGTLTQLRERMTPPRSADFRAHSPACLLTSYALGRRDRELLAQHTFDCLVLDEAQNIKNPEAAQSQAVRQLSARRRVALTGTPVENRLTELWSILDFLNPGLLGTQAAFKRQFAVPIERYADKPAAELLRRVTAPFVMRRMKTDPNIAPDLPDKIETTRYCPLTREQAALYQTAVDKGLDEIAGLEQGIERRGRILAMLTQIKQICNHPAQFLKDSIAAPRRSGKLTRFLQLIDEVFENEAAAIVFTQYREMGNILEKVLSEQLGQPIPFLHGGLSRTQRDDMVLNFQSPHGPPIIIVSLRAGGTGLNLTRANHVFHYDRWWNPAVEDQATDRAFRIGQTRDVTVHRLVVQGTLEEQIHQLLEDKRQLADRVVGEGETWLSELDDDALKSLISLGQDAVLDDLEGHA
jgi:superfamily II DNA or RNA helicase